MKAEGFRCADRGNGEWLGEGVDGLRQCQLLDHRAADGFIPVLHVDDTSVDTHTPVATDTMIIKHPKRWCVALKGCHTVHIDPCGLSKVDTGKQVNNLLTVRVGL